MHMNMHACQSQYMHAHVSTELYVFLCTVAVIPWVIVGVIAVVVIIILLGIVLAAVVLKKR